MTRSQSENVTFPEKAVSAQLSITWYMMQDLRCFIVLYSFLFWFDFIILFGYHHPSVNGDKRRFVFGSGATISRWKIPKCKSLIAWRLGHFCNPGIYFYLSLQLSHIKHQKTIKLKIMMIVWPWNFSACTTPSYIMIVHMEFEHLLQLIWSYTMLMEQTT